MDSAAGSIWLGQLDVLLQMVWLAHAVWVSTFKDGLIVHVKLYMSQLDALEAAGLRE